MDDKPSPATDDRPPTPQESLLSCRLFIDPPAIGALNMAVDEALLDQAANDGLAALRFYQWSEPTLSLGYFQSHSERFAHPASRCAPVVRRLSGGGALLHDRELTYSLCLPARHALSRQSARLYGVAHLALVEVLAASDVNARLYDERAAQVDASHEAEPGDEPFLCFARRSAADVVAPTDQGAIKIVGSAQRRRRGAVLQHGALLLDASRCAPELSGLQQVSRRGFDQSAFIAAWCKRLAERLELAIIPAGESPAAVGLQIRQTLLEKYGGSAWTARR